MKISFQNWGGFGDDEHLTYDASTIGLAPDSPNVWPPSFIVEETVFNRVPTPVLPDDPFVDYLSQDNVLLRVWAD